MEEDKDYSWIVWLIVIGIAGYFLFFNGNSTASVNVNSSDNTQYSSDDGNSSDGSIDENINQDSDLNFNGYDCTEDCSGHEAGYDWAQDHDITQDDVDNYSGNSDSFREGMQSYVDGD